MKQEKVCIVIPVYQKISDALEIISLKQGLKVFNSHPVIFICPNSFDESWLDEYKNFHPKISFEKFDNKNFTDVNSYSLLLLSQNFYARFLNYNFMLIYQLDAYVFRDELEYWCDRGFDYIGAPWFLIDAPWFDANLPMFQYLDKTEKILLPNAGNGGFSLKNIQKVRELLQRRISFLEVLKLKKMSKKFRMIQRKHGFLAKKIIFTKLFLKFAFRKNLFSEVCDYLFSGDDCPSEDAIFAFAYPLIFPEFKVAKSSEAIPFSFEAYPEKLYEMNGKNLPFGCHSYHKYSPEFWQKFIPTIYTHSS